MLARFHKVGSVFPHIIALERLSVKLQGRKLASSRFRQLVRSFKVSFCIFADHVLIEAAFLHKPVCSSPSCDRPFSVEEFFKDAPWLNIPEDRRGEILIEPLYPPGRLLGGAPPQSKISKLAALAAARKSKGNETTKSNSQKSTTSIALLDKLSGRDQNTSSVDPPPALPEKVQVKSEDESRNFKPQNEIQASQKRERQPSGLEPELQRLAKAPRQSTNPQDLPSPGAIVAPIAAPSKFAQFLCGESSFWQDPPPVASFKPYYTIPQDLYTNLDAFAGPSPDDIVLNAQNSKGEFSCNTVVSSS